MDNNNINNVDNEENGALENANQLEINARKAEEFQQLMKDSSTNLDDYYDKNNPVVLIILLILGAFIVIGSIIVILMGLAS